MSYEITVAGGTSVRLPVKGKYCDRDIVVTATDSAAEPVIEALEITENGTYTPPDGVDGYSPVTVNVVGGLLLYEPECTLSAGVVTAPMPEGYTAETFLEKVVFCELSAQMESAQGSIIAAANIAEYEENRIYAMCINSSGSLSSDYAIAVTDTQISWAFDPYSIIGLQSPQIRMGLL